jgi:hypothetical protein
MIGCKSMMPATATKVQLQPRTATVSGFGCWPARTSKKPSDSATLGCGVVGIIRKYCEYWKRVFTARHEAKEEVPSFDDGWHRRGNRSVAVATDD